MPAGADKPVYAPYIEHVPPDVTAAIFWLKNRDPQHWRDVHQMEHVLGKYMISDKPMTEEEWARERATVIEGGWSWAPQLLNLLAAFWSPVKMPYDVPRTGVDEKP